jgi:hypothetical protein
MTVAGGMALVGLVMAQRVRQWSNNSAAEARRAQDHRWEVYKSTLDDTTAAVSRVGNANSMQTSSTTTAVIGSGSILVGDDQPVAETPGTTCEPGDSDTAGIGGLSRMVGKVKSGSGRGRRGRAHATQSGGPRSSKIFSGSSASNSNNSNKKVRLSPESQNDVAPVGASSNTAVSDGNHGGASENQATRRPEDMGAPPAN